jgi:hypothetical protein
MAGQAISSTRPASPGGSAVAACVRQAGAGCFRVRHQAQGIQADRAVGRKGIVQPGKLASLAGIRPGRRRPRDMAAQ